MTSTTVDNAAKPVTFNQVIAAFVGTLLVAALAFSVFANIQLMETNTKLEIYKNNLVMDLQDQTMAYKALQLENKLLAEYNRVLVAQNK